MALIVRVGGFSLPSLSLWLSRLAVESTLLFLSMTISDKQYRDAHNKSIYHRTLLHLTTVCLFLCASPTTCQIDDARLCLCVCVFFPSLSLSLATVRILYRRFCNKRDPSAIIIIGFSHSFVRLLLATHSVHVRGPLASRASVCQNKLLSSQPCLFITVRNGRARHVSSPTRCSLNSLDDSREQVTLIERVPGKSDPSRARAQVVSA